MRTLCAIYVVFSIGMSAQTWNVSAGPGGIPIHTNVNGAQTQAVMCATTVRDGIIYAWRDTRTGTNGQDIWCQKYTPCGAVAPGWPAAGLSICNATGTQQLPAIVADGSDGAIIVWQDNRLGNYDIYGQHVTGAGTTMWGSATTGMAICTQTGNQQNVHVCTDGAGGAIISWDDQRTGNWDVWTQKVTSGGIVSWNAAGGGNPVQTFQGTQDQNAICADGAGGAYYAWEDSRSTANSGDIYATRFDANGNAVAGWSPFLTLSSQNQSQITPCIALFPNGDVAFAWCDPFGAGQSIQAVKLNSSGVAQPGWTLPNGNLVGYAITSSGNPGTASTPRMVTDCSGGMIISYRSPYGSGDNDVLTRRMNSNGTQGTFEYTAFGTNWEGNHEIASDGNGGAWNVFEDRNGPTVIEYRKFTNTTVVASSGVGARDIPNICAMGGVAYFVWEDARTGTFGGNDLYGGATSALAPPPILNSSATAVYTATTCGITTQSVTVCSGASITFTVPLPGGLFNTYTFLDGATTLQTGSSNTYVTSGLSVGTHTITATSQTAAGCVTAPSNAIVLTVSAGPNTTVSSQTNELCFGGTTGAATITASSGTAPYTYAWTPSGGTGATATGLTAQTYTCTVTDANGCTRTQTVTITQPTQITGSATSTPATCGNNNGSATASPTGGTGAYTYVWAPSGGTSATASNLTSGNYTCTVTDANGCTAQFSTSVNNSGAPTVSIQTQTNPACNGQTGSATIAASGGQSPYTYSWAPSGGNAATASGLSAGTYTCTVTDANNCVQTQVVTITQPTLLTATSGGTDPLCSSGATGTATVTPSGGTGAYTYAWSPSGGTGSSASNLNANTYTCTITDANGCTTQQIVTLTAPTAITASPSQTNVSCNGGSNGTASVNPSGGTPGYTYSWLPSGGTGSTATNLNATNYTCTITDANGCTSTQTFALTAPTALSATTSQTNVACNGDSTGVASVSASGGAPVYAYSWSPYGGVSASATNLASGTFTCTISDANGCQLISTVTLTQANAITSTITFTNALCNGAASGTANASPSGGNPGYTYSWSSGATTATASSLAAGTYTVTITDLSGCTHQNTAIISEPTAITSTSGSTDATCNSSNGSATVTPTGGTPGYTYSWSPSGGTAATASGLSAGVYTCLVTDLNGCVHTATVPVNNLGAPSVTLNASNDVTCNGGNDGAASVNVSGGNPGYTYAWTPSGGTASSASSLTAGTYLCTVTDAVGCIQSLPVTINEPAIITSSATITDATCGNSNGQAVLNVSGGNGTYSYNWSSGGTAATETNLAAGNYTCIVTDIAGCSNTFSITISNAGSPNVTLAAQTDVSCYLGSNGSVTVNVSGGSPGYVYSWAPSGGTSATASSLTAGTYTCVVTDNNGCTQSFSTTLTEPTALLSTSSSTPDMCNAGNGTASVSISGGTGPYTYAWTPSGGNNATANSLSPATYTCQVIDANGCSIIDSATVLASGGPTVQLQSSTDPSCYNGSDGTATISVTAGNGPYTYAWSPSGGNAVTGTGLDATQTYTCTITDVNGCTSTQTVLLSQPPVYTASVTASTPVSCFGGIDGTATVTGTGGTGPYTYLWSPSLQTTTTASNLVAGGYVVTVTDANGCTTQASVTITQPSTAVAVNVTPTNGCGTASAAAIASGGAGPYSYQWSPSGGTAATATGLSSGSYTVIATDANGCADTTVTSVIANPNPTATVTASQSTVQLGSSANLTAAGGTTYSWTPSSGLSCTNCAAPVATPSATTTYCAMATDANGCQDSACVVITVDTDCGELFVPNAFSPNNDGSNDLLSIYGGACLLEMEFVVYDRWGEEVYRSTDATKSWDGMYKGQELNAGVYVYYLRGTLYNGNPVSLEGNISLIR